MSRRGGRKHKNNKNSFDSGIRNGCYEPFQSADLNSRIYNYYVDIIVKMAISRFKWVGLPKTCDERYLETSLVTEGKAVIAYPSKLRGTFFSLKCADAKRPNMYDCPSNWFCIGSNGTHYYANRNRGVVVYDNTTRYPLMQGIQLYANELTHIRITKRLNRMHQQVPFILSGPQEKKEDMANLYKQVAGGEAAVLTSKSFTNEISFAALQTNVPYLGEEMAIDEQNVWGRVYTMLGIENTTMKQERQTEDEIKAQTKPVSLVMRSALYERRKAADELNRRFSRYLDEPIQVIPYQDNVTDNYNYAHNIIEQITVGDE